MDASNAPAETSVAGRLPPAQPRMTTAEMLARLVAFDTTSRNSNLKLIEFVRVYLDAHGVPYRVSTDPTGQKANIHAIVGPQSAGGVALSGHVDTVPVDGQAWSADPFTLRSDGGQTLRARRLRHEGLRRFLPRRGARLPGETPAAPAAPVHHLRRGDRFRRRGGWCAIWPTPG